jgi:hypothetical protein
VNVHGEPLLVHTAEWAPQAAGSVPASPALITAATDTKVRHRHPFRLYEFLPLGHVSSEGLLVDLAQGRVRSVSRFLFLDGELIMAAKGISWGFSI